MITLDKPTTATLHFLPRADPILDLAETAIAVIIRLLAQDRPLVLAYSGGKDSSVVCALAMEAARRFALLGGKAYIHIVTNDTLVENAEISRHYKIEMQKMVAYGLMHGFSVQTHVVLPAMAANWQVKVLSGRGLPSFAGEQARCSMDLKVVPMGRWRRRFFAAAAKQGLPDPVTLLGTRYDESTRRASNMEKRGDSADAPVLNKEKFWVLCPIARWEEDDVFAYLGYVTSGIIPSFSDMESVLRIYAHSAGSSCAVVASALHADRPVRGGCGARHGCHVCQMAEDKSLEAMIEYDESYHYAKGLSRLNHLLRATRYDWTRRGWVGRVIQSGWLEIKPDAYHPAFLRELTRYMLQLDYDELQRATAANEDPKFCLMPPAIMVAVDALQSLNGVARAFSVWADYRDITRRGIRYDIPEVSTFPPTPVPATRYMHVGREWEMPADTDDGMRDSLTEAITDLGNCLPGTKTLASGHEVLDMDTYAEFDIAAEAAEFLFQFEADELAERHDQLAEHGSVTSAYRYYLILGVLKLHRSHIAKHDEILRRTTHKERCSMTVGYDAQSLIKQSVPFASVPLDVQKAFQARKRQRAG